MQVRANPLPAGRYWIFVQQSALEIMERWLKTNVNTVTLERRENSGGLWPFVSPNESFFIFAVRSPTLWTRGIGFPNAADSATQAAADVTQRPPPLTVKQAAKDVLETASEAATSAVTATVLVVAIVLWVSSQRR